MKLLLELFTIDNLVKWVMTTFIMLGMFHAWIFFNVEFLGNDLTVGKPRIERNR
jgi:hypothetical protein